MRTFVYIPFVLLLMIFCEACSQKDFHKDILLQAENLLEEDPKQSLELLESSSERMSSMIEGTRMHYILLLTKAKEACGIPHTFDSLIEKPVRYFEAYGTPYQAAEAYYYQGCVYRDQNDIDYALEAFQLAAYLANVSDHNLLGKAHSQMGNLFTYQKMNFEAMESYRIAAFHAGKDNDSIAWAERLKHTAHAFTVLNKPDSALHYYELALHANPYLQRKDIENEKANLYIRMKDFQNARLALEHNLDAYLTWADYYHGINKKDSASRYYSYALKKQETNDLQRKAIYQRLSAYAEEKREIQKAYLYLKMADQIQDTIQYRYEAEMARQAQLIHTYRNASRKKYQKVSVSTKEEFFLTFPLGSLITITLMGLGTVIVVFFKRKKTFKSQLPEAISLHKSVIYQLIKDQAHDPDFKLTDEEWKELQVEIDNAYNHFTARLYAVCPKLNKTELHVCYLLKLEVQPTDIAHIIVRQPNTVSSIRERLYKKIHGENGTARQLDQFIEEF